MSEIDKAAAHQVWQPAFPPADRWVVAFAGASSLTLGVFLLAAGASLGPPSGPFAGFAAATAATVSFLLTLLFGALLGLAFVHMADDPLGGRVLATGFSVALIGIGGVLGLAMGVLGLALVGAAFALRVGER